MHWFPVDGYTIARLPDLVAPAATQLRTPASRKPVPDLRGNRVLWPDQRHVQLVRDAPRTTLVAALLALALPAPGSL